MTSWRGKAVFSPAGVLRDEAVHTDEVVEAQWIEDKPAGRILKNKHNKSDQHNYIRTVQVSPLT